jgi:hypothetical protein
MQSCATFIRVMGSLQRGVALDSERLSTRETWLRPNRRAIAAGFLMPILLLASGLALVLGSVSGSVFLGIGWFCVALGLIAALGMIFLWRQPRLAYEKGELIVYLKSAAPYRIPIEIVECFMAGQTSTSMPRLGPRPTPTKVRSIIVRLAESARQWHQRQVTPKLGEWREGYITIHGAWCEPIHADLLTKLNDRLVRAHREQKAQAAKEA